MQISSAPRIADMLSGKTSVANGAAEDLAADSMGVAAEGGEGAPDADSFASLLLRCPQELSGGSAKKMTARFSPVGENADPVPKDGTPDSDETDSPGGIELIAANVVPLTETVSLKGSDLAAVPGGKQSPSPTAHIEAETAKLEAGKALSTAVVDGPPRGEGEVADSRAMQPEQASALAEQTSSLAGRADADAVKIAAAEQVKADLDAGTDAAPPTDMRKSEAPAPVFAQQDVTAAATPATEAVSETIASVQPGMRAGGRVSQRPAGLPSSASQDAQSDRGEAGDAPPVTTQRPAVQTLPLAGTDADGTGQGSAGRDAEAPLSAPTPAGSQGASTFSLAGAPSALPASSSAPLSALPSFPGPAPSGGSLSDAQQAWADETSQHILQEMGGRREASFRLTPANLGTLEVKIELDPATPRIELVVQDERARQHLAGALDRLSDQLDTRLGNQAQGERQMAGGGQGAAGGREQQPQADQQLSRPLREERAGSAANTHAATIQPQGNAKESGRVSLLA